MIGAISFNMEEMEDRLGPTFDKVFPNHGRYCAAMLSIIEKKQGGGGLSWRDPVGTWRLWSPFALPKREEVRKDEKRTIRNLSQSRRTKRSNKNQRRSVADHRGTFFMPTGLYANWRTKARDEALLLIVLPGGSPIQGRTFLAATIASPAHRAAQAPAGRSWPDPTERRRPRPQRESMGSKLSSLFTIGVCCVCLSCSSRN